MPFEKRGLAIPHRGQTMSVPSALIACISAPVFNLGNSGDFGNSGNFLIRVNTQ
jgi:hypothetical protein